MTKEIPLGTLLHAIVLVATAVAFWMGLSARLEVLQNNQEWQARQILELKEQVDKIEDIVRPMPAVRPPTR